MLNGVKSIFYLLLIMSTYGCSSQLDLDGEAWVSSQNLNAISVLDKNFETIQAALDAAPEQSFEPYIIHLSPGDFYEKITITKPNIYILGAGTNKTRIYFDAYAGQKNNAGDLWGTSGSGTIIVRAPDITFEDLTIENSFDYLANDARPKTDAARIQGTQAVAVHLDHGSDRVLMRRVKLLGYQDTLFVDAGRAWFDQAVIAGNVDFIFGAGNALFTDSEIRTRIRGSSNNPYGYLTAPSTNIGAEFGLTFIHCRLTQEPGVPNNSTSLGRPWHPTTEFVDGRYADPDAIGKTVFLQSTMAAHIAESGWHSMAGTSIDGYREQFMPESARFFEFKSRGAGAVINSQRRQLTSAEAGRYTKQIILGDWQPN